ncbi:hypothetical protein FDZ84_05415 [Saccharopolyspora sp. ASAGF58]|nr:hypothetical protein FDZ84_05415 [Saccharopolyspora sp. ASAGF58]
MRAEQASRSRHGPWPRPLRGISLDPRRPPLAGGPNSSEECAAVADLAFAVLLIGGFLVLALTLRGLERL